LRRHSCFNETKIKIFFFNPSLFEPFLQGLPDLEGFADQYDPAGFTVQAMEQGGLSLWLVAKMTTELADQAGILSILGRMADQTCRFVDHQQFDIFINGAKFRVIDEPFFWALPRNQSEKKRLPIGPYL